MKSAEQPSRNATWLRQARIDAAARGLCYVCRCRFPRPGVRTCDDCLKRIKDGERAGKRLDSRRRRARKYSTQRREKRLAAGICTRCAGRPPASGRTQCSICLDTLADRARIARRASGAKGDGSACSICGSTEHNAMRHGRSAVLT